MLFIAMVEVEGGETKLNLRKPLYCPYSNNKYDTWRVPPGKQQQLVLRDLKSKY